MRSVPVATVVSWGALAALLGAAIGGSAYAQGLGGPDPGKRVIAVRAPAVVEGYEATAQDPADPEQEVGPGASYAHAYTRVDHPLYRLFLKRHEQVGRWFMEPWEAPDKVDSGSLITFVKAAKTKAPDKFATLSVNPGKVFRLKGESVKAGTLTRLGEVTFVFDPLWTLGDAVVEKTELGDAGGKPTLKSFQGKLPVRLRSRIFDARSGAKLSEQTEDATASLLLADLPLSTDAKAADAFEAGLDWKGKQELELGRIVMPESSPQVQQAIGKQVLPTADAMVRRVVARTKDLDAFRLRPYVSGAADSEVRVSHGRNAGIGIDELFWVVKPGSRDGKPVEETVGFIKVRNVEPILSRAQAISVGKPIQTGDGLLHIPHLGLEAVLKGAVTPLSLMVPAPPVFMPAATGDVGLTPPQRPVPVQAMVSLPLELDLGPLSGMPALSETYFLLEPTISLRLPALDFIGLAGFRRKIYLGPLVVTPGLKSGVTYSSTTLGTAGEDIEILNPDDPEQFKTLRTGATVTMTQLGFSVGPEVAFDFHFHPNLSAGLFVDFVYTLSLGKPSIAARPAASDPDRAIVSLVPQDLDPAPLGLLQGMRLGTGAQFTVSF